MLRDSRSGRPRSGRPPRRERRARGRPSEHQDHRGDRRQHHRGHHGHPDPDVPGRNAPRSVPGPASIPRMRSRTMIHATSAAASRGAGDVDTARSLVRPEVRSSRTRRGTIAAESDASGLHRRPELGRFHAWTARPDAGERRVCVREIELDRSPPRDPGRLRDLRLSCLGFVYSMPPGIFVITPRYGFRRIDPAEGLGHRVEDIAETHTWRCAPRDPTRTPPARTIGSFTFGAMKAMISKKVSPCCPLIACSSASVCRSSARVVDDRLDVAVPLPQGARPVIEDTPAKPAQGRRHRTGRGRSASPPCPRSRRAWASG